MKRLDLSLLAGAALLALGGSAHAVSYTYSNLVVGGVGSSFNPLFIGASDSLNVSGFLQIGLNGTGSLYQTASTASVANLDIGHSSSTSSGNGLYVFSGGALHAGSITIGTNGGSPYKASTGTFTQQGGSADLTSILYVGRDTNTHGSYNLNNGTLASSGATVGASGTGNFTQAGGTHTAASLAIGDGSGSGTGTYTQSGGTLNVNGEFAVGRGKGTGNFVQSGGTVNAADSWGVTVGSGTSSSGTYTLSGSGTLNSKYESIGFFGTGVFTQTGGSNQVGDTLYLAQAAAASGTYNLNGGSLSVGTIAKGQGTSAFNIDGGSLVLTGSSIGAGSFALGATTSSNFSLGAGKTLTTDALTIGAHGTLVDNGTVQAGSVLLDGGRVGGAGSVNGDLTARNGATVGVAGQIGTLTLNGSARFDSSKLSFEIASASSFDKIVFNSAVDLGTTTQLRVSLTGGYAPATTTWYDLIDYHGSVSGSLVLSALPTLAAGRHWDTSRLYTTGELGLVVGAVPEPDTWALMAFGLVGLGVAARRRRA